MLGRLLGLVWLGDWVEIVVLNNRGIRLFFINICFFDQRQCKFIEKLVVKFCFKGWFGICLILFNFVLDKKSLEVVYLFQILFYIILAIVLVMAMDLCLYQCILKFYFWENVFRESFVLIWKIFWGLSFYEEGFGVGGLVFLECLQVFIIFCIKGWCIIFV